MKRDKIFICYAREDKKHMEALRKSFGAYADNIPFCDKDLEAGKWEPQIYEAIDNAQIAICLVSGRFFDRKSFIQNEELPRIYAACDNGQLVIIPILVHECKAFMGSKLKTYQWYNEDDEPLAALESNDFKYKRELDSIASNITNKLKERLSSLDNKTPGNDIAIQCEMEKSNVSYDWLWEIKNPIALPPNLEELGKELQYEAGIEDHTSTISSRNHILENNNPHAFQSVAHIVETIMKHRRIVVLSGPQLSGKSVLSEFIIRELAQGATSVTRDLICLQDIRRAFNQLKETKEINTNTVKFLVYAIWARQIVTEYYYKKLTPAEQRFARTNPNCDDLFKYLRDLEWVATDLQERHKKYALSGSAADFLALEESVILILRPLVKKPNFILAIEAEDVHDYVKVREDAPQVGEAIVRQFWDTVKKLAEEDSEYMASAALGSVRFVITARPNEVHLSTNGPHLPVVEIDPFGEDDCLQFANKIGMNDLFDKDELQSLIHDAHIWTNGYAWFLTRFLRVAAFLRTNVKKQTVKSLVDAISSCPLFWYEFEPCNVDFLAIGEAFRQRKYGISRAKSQRSPFLVDIIDSFKRAPRLISDYTHVLTSPSSYDLDDEESYLRTLVQLGLIRFDRDLQEYIPSNNIVKRHFTPLLLSGALAELQISPKREDRGR